MFFKNQIPVLKFLSTLVLIFQFNLSNGQEKVLLDGVVAIVGNTVVLKSEVEYQLDVLKDKGVSNDDIAECMVWRDLLFQKLLIHRSEVDSMDVTSKDVDNEIDRRLNYLLGQMGGSEVEFEKYFNKTVLEFKEEIRPTVKDNIGAQRMQAKISENVTVSPSEVETYYKTIPKDSLPIISEQYKLAQIYLYPKPSEFEKARIFAELNELRTEILNGKDFGLAALLHSQDPGTRNKKGELGFVSRDQLVPEFSAAAFKLQAGEISEIVESDFGFHIIQMIEKKGSFVNVRHILMTPKIYSTDIEIAKLKADSVLKEIKLAKQTFNKIASLLSDDLRGRENGGVLVNAQSGDDYFGAQDLEEELFFVVQSLKKDEVSKAELVQVPGGKNAFRIIKLMDKVDFHTASITSDYSKIKDAALLNKKQKVVDTWVKSKLSDTYIKLPNDLNNCEELKIWNQQVKMD